MNLPTNIQVLEIVSDYTGFYREVKFSGNVTYSKWFGFRKEIKNHVYVAFGNVGNWIIVNVDGVSVKVPVHFNSFIRPILDTEALHIEYRKSYKVDFAALLESSEKLGINCV